MHQAGAAARDMPICFLRRLTALAQGPHFDPAACGWVTREKRQRHQADDALEPQRWNLSISVWCLAGADALLNAAQLRRPCKARPLPLSIWM
jgi:hypothetical protein